MLSVSLVSADFVWQSEVVLGFHSIAETVCVNQDKNLMMATEMDRCRSYFVRFACVLTIL